MKIVKMALASAAVGCLMGAILGFAHGSSDERKCERTLERVLDLKAQGLKEIGAKGEIGPEFAAKVGATKDAWGKPLQIVSEGAAFIVYSHEFSPGHALRRHLAQGNVELDAAKLPPKLLASEVGRKFAMWAAFADGKFVIEQ